MYPPQTSLIPATVSLIRFFFTNGFSAFSLDYPYWYLGTTPFKYLIGPVVPFFYQIAHILAPKAQLFTISIYLVIVGIIVSGVGWVYLISEIFKKDGIKKSKLLYLLPFIFYLLFPWKYLTALAVSEVASFMAKSFLPFGLVLIWRYLQKKGKGTLIIASLGSAILLLTHTNIATEILIGSVCLALTVSWKEGKLRNVSKRIKASLYPLLFGFLASFLWYGVGFWFRILSNPSIGGKSGLGAIVGVFDFLRMLLPIALAVVIVYFKSKFKDRFQVFIWSWLGIFFMFTLFRFMANPEFYMDWSSWFYEIEIGLWLIVVSFLYGKKYVLGIAPLTISILATLIFYDALDRPRLISDKFPKIVNSAIILRQIAGKEIVFTTGSSVFWLNTIGDTPQVRGGRDEVSVDPNWHDAAYNFREGEDIESIKSDLQLLGVKYVLANTESSTDFYKDFKNLDLWEDLGEGVTSANGDIIYKVQK